MTVLAIVATDLKRLFREKAALFWIFVGPVIFVVFFGLLFPQRPPRATTVSLVNADADDRVARALGVILESDGIEVSREAAPGAWVVGIPEGAAAALAAGEPVKLTLKTREKEQTNAERRILFRLQKALLSTFLQANPADTEGEDAEALRRRFAREQAISVRREEIGIARTEITSGFQRSVPAYIVMFVFLNLLVSGAGIAEERASGRLRRLFVAPVTRRSIVLGKLLSRVATGWIQMAYMLALGVLIFGVRWAEHPWVFFGFLTLFAFASASVGLLLGTLFKDPDKCETTAIWTAILLSPLGGLWWPLEVVGPTMRQVGRLVPTGWAMEGVNSMLAFGAGARDVAPYALALAGLMAVALTLAARRIRP